MEQRGENQKKNVFIIIPARYASTRLPGKLLLEIAGKPLILHTLSQAGKASNVERVIVATDDQRIYRAVMASGGDAVMTAGDHVSGSDRVAEVAEGLPAGSVIVNVQGDEPTISPVTIERAIDALISDDGADMSTTCEPIRDGESELFNPNVVKVVAGHGDYAIYFSRSPVPFPREAAQRHRGDAIRAIETEPELLGLFKKHTGLYVYRREFLLKFAKTPPTRLEQTEMLEQLRALEMGAKIKVVEVGETSVGVDTRDDFERVRGLIEQNG